MILKINKMRIGCILVLYNPDLNVLSDVIFSIIKQVNKLFIIDNSKKKNDIEFLNHKKIKYKFLNKNIGIAAAQNYGIEYFSKLNYDYLFFMDQDSIVSEKLIDNLVESTIFLNKKGYKTAVVCPTAVNKHDGLVYSEKYPIIKKIKLFSRNKSYKLNMVNSCSSSGSLVKMENFKKVGYMDSSLFIDGVDNEWCWRAKDKGNLDSFVSLDLSMNHYLGEGDRSFFGIKISISSPTRIYFQFRNYFILLRRGYVPNIWKIKNGIKYISKTIYFPIFVNPRLEYLKKIIFGIIDGINYKNKH